MLIFANTTPAVATIAKGRGKNTKAATVAIAESAILAMTAAICRTLD
jgi:hypothetical protein